MYFVSTIQPVANFDCNTNIKNAFDVLGNNLGSADLYMEYIDLMEQNITEEM
jgi:hypothetical protein